MLSSNDDNIKACCCCEKGRSTETEHEWVWQWDGRIRLRRLATLRRHGNKGRRRRIMMHAAGNV